MRYFTGCYYHIFNRGNNKQKIFQNHEDYLRLLELFQKNRGRCPIGFIAYCLMPNHYHLVLRQDGEHSISKFLKSTFQSYVQSFNKRYERTGQLFEGNAQGKLIDDEDYLLHVCRYTHLNPVEARLVHNIEEWKYSNYLEFIGKRSGTLHDLDFSRDYLSGHEDYQRFVLEYLMEQDRYGDIRKYIFDD